MPDDRTKELIRELKAAGYMVTKIPECNRPPGHGRHGLITRTASCEGVGPIPHGYHSSSRGTFGYWVHCQCGHNFAEYAADDESPTPWDQHKAEHGIVDEATR